MDLSSVPEALVTIRAARDKMKGKSEGKGAADSFSGKGKGKCRKPKSAKHLQDKLVRSNSSRFVCEGSSGLLLLDAVVCGVVCGWGDLLLPRPTLATVSPTLATVSFWHFREEGVWGPEGWGPEGWVPDIVIEYMRIPQCETPEACQECAGTVIFSRFWH